MHTPTHSEVAIYSGNMPTMLNRMKNHILRILFFELRVITFRIYGDTPGVPSTKKKLFKSGQIYRKDAH